MGSNSSAPSDDASMDNMYSEMASDPMSAPGHPTYHQYQGAPQQGYPFALESNTEAVWSNAPSGFEWVVLVLFLLSPDLTFTFADWRNGVPTLWK